MQPSQGLHQLLVMQKRNPSRCSTTGGGSAQQGATTSVWARRERACRRWARPGERERGYGSRDMKEK
jgi:hypothetical protein